jgi:hypothetical protein
MMKPETSGQFAVFFSFQKCRLGLFGSPKEEREGNIRRGIGEKPSQAFVVKLRSFVGFARPEVLDSWTATYLHPYQLGFPSRSRAVCTLRHESGMERLMEKLFVQMR